MGAPRQCPEFKALFQSEDQLLHCAALSPRLSVRPALPLLRRDDLLALGSADAYHFEPKAQHFLSPLLSAVAIIGAGR